MNSPGILDPRPSFSDLATYLAEIHELRSGRRVLLGEPPENARNSETFFGALPFLLADGFLVAFDMIAVYLGLAASRH